MELIQAPKPQHLLHAGLKAAFVSMVVSVPLAPVLSYALMVTNSIESLVPAEDQELFLAMGWIAALMFASFIAFMVLFPITFLHGVISGSSMKGARLILLFSPLLFADLVLTALVIGEFGLNPFGQSIIAALWGCSLFGALVYITIFNQTMEQKLLSPDSTTTQLSNT